MSSTQDSKNLLIPKARKEVTYLGISDTILGILYMTGIASLAGVSDFYPHVTFWIFIIIFHVVHITAAASLVVGNIKDGNKTTRFGVCKFWLSYSRYVLRWFFPLECVLVVGVLSGDKDNELIFAWILFIIVEELFLYLAIESVNSYVSLLTFSDNETNVHEGVIDANSPTPSASSSTVQSTSGSTDVIIKVQ